MSWSFYRTVKGGPASGQLIHEAIEGGAAQVREPERSIRHHVLRGCEEAVASLSEDSLVQIEASGSQLTDNDKVVSHNVTLTLKTHRHA